MSDIDLSEALGSDNAAEDTTEESTDKQTLAYIRDELIRYRPDIPEERADLSQAVSEFLAASVETQNGDIGGIVAKEFHKLRSVPREQAAADGGEDEAYDEKSDDETTVPAFSTYPMYDSKMVSDGSEAFPDKCTGCPHYGTACPIVRDPRQKQELQRLTDGETDDQTIRDLHQLAMDNECHILKGILDSYESDLGPLLQAGMNLLMATQDVMTYNSTEEQIRQYVERAKSSTSAVSGTGGGD